METRMLIGSKPKDLEKQINEYLSKGWRLRGPFKVVTREHGRGKDWLQMVWRKEDIEDAQSEETESSGDTK